MFYVTEKIFKTDGFRSTIILAYRYKEDNMELNEPNVNQLSIRIDDGFWHSVHSSATPFAWKNLQHRAPLTAYNRIAFCTLVDFIP